MQFDVYRNPNPGTSDETPYLLDIQSDLLADLATRVVVPLDRAEVAPPIRRLNPVFVVGGRSVKMATADLAALHRRSLGDVVCSLADRRDEIIAAVDFLITGI